MPGRVFIEFCGQEWSLAPGEELTFGRTGDLVVDDNPYLHRTVGHIGHVGGAWWLRNVGRRLAMTILDRRGTSSATIGPGSSVALVHGEFMVAFAAGPSVYEISGTLEDVERAVDLAGLGPDGGAEGDDQVPVTLEWGRVELNDDQRTLLTVMCSERLRFPADRFSPVPSNRSCAATLGWTQAKFNRKLDHLCEKLHRAGVRGVHGDVSLLASDRRRVLVDHAVQAGLVSLGDLEELGLSAPAAPLVDRPG